MSREYWTIRVTMYDDSNIATPYWFQGFDQGDAPEYHPTPRYRFRFARAEDAHEVCTEIRERDEAMAPVVVHVRVTKP